MVKGQTATISYDFDGASSPVELKITWDPSGDVETIEITAEDPDVEITAPSNADSVSIEDTTAQSRMFATSVNDGS